jgi:hypothetical protein
MDAELKGGIEHSKSSLPESKGHELASAHRRRAEMAKQVHIFLPRTLIIK